MRGLAWVVQHFLNPVCSGMNQSGTQGPHPRGWKESVAATGAGSW
jgi:hypothetical protein